MHGSRLLRLALAAAVVVTAAVTGTPSAATADPELTSARTPAGLSLAAAGAARLDGSGTQAVPKGYLDNVDGRREWFWIGTAFDNQVPGALWHQWEVYPGGPVTPPAFLDGELHSGVAGGVNRDGRLEVFSTARGLDVAHIWQLTPGGNWSTWASLGINNRIRNGVAVAENYDGRLEVFGQDLNTRELRHIKQGVTIGTWEAWGNLGGIMASGGDPWFGPYQPEGGITVHVWGNDGKVHTKWQMNRNCCWTPTWH